MSGWGWVRICSMLAAFFAFCCCCFLLLLLVVGYLTFGSFGYGYGNSNSKILLSG